MAIRDWNKAVHKTLLATLFTPLKLQRNNTQADSFKTQQRSTLLEKKQLLHTN